MTALRKEVIWCIGGWGDKKRPWFSQLKLSSRKEEMI